MTVINLAQVRCDRERYVIVLAATTFWNAEAPADSRQPATIEDIRRLRHEVDIGRDYERSLNVLAPDARPNLRHETALRRARDYLSGVSGDWQSLAPWSETGGRLSTMVGRL